MESDVLRIIIGVMHKPGISTYPVEDSDLYDAGPHTGNDLA
jgi:hypothetical protein